MKNRNLTTLINLFLLWLWKSNDDGHFSVKDSGGVLFQQLRQRCLYSFLGEPSITRSRLLQSPDQRFHYGFMEKLLLCGIMLFFF